jgi:hypothetical protein
MSRKAPGVELIDRPPIEVDNQPEYGFLLAKPSFQQIRTVRFCPFFLYAVVCVFRCPNNRLLEMTHDAFDRDALACGIHITAGSDANVARC